MIYTKGWRKEPHDLALLPCIKLGDSHLEVDNLYITKQKFIQTTHLNLEAIINELFNFSKLHNISSLPNLLTMHIPL